MVHLVLSIFSTFSFPLLINTPMMGLVDPYVAYGSAHTLMPTLARWLGPLRNLELVAIHHHQNRQPLKEKKKGKENQYQQIQTVQTKSIGWDRRTARLRLHDRNGKRFPSTPRIASPPPSRVSLPISPPPPPCLRRWCPGELSSAASARHLSSPHAAGEKPNGRRRHGADCLTPPSGRINYHPWCAASSRARERRSYRGRIGLEVSIFFSLGHLRHFMRRR